MTFILLFLSLSAFASSDSTDAFDKSYARDNTFCSYKNHRMEFLIRGGSKFTEPKERGYGELLFYRTDKKAKLLEMNGFRSDTYRFFMGTSPLCSKSHGYQLADSTMAVLLLKENRPFKDKLVIQQVDLKTFTPGAFVETNYPTDKAFKTADGFTFRTVPENHNPEVGKVSLEGQEYIFQEKEFPYWINYSLKGFVVSPEMTFTKFPFKNYFKDIRDFQMLTGWNETEKKFSNSVMYIAVNHKIKKRCLLFIGKKQKLEGNEMWRCHTI